MVVCKACGYENEEGARFCGSCGSFLEWSGEPVEPEPAATPAVPAEPPGGTPAAEPGPVEVLPEATGAPSEPPTEPGGTWRPGREGESETISQARGPECRACGLANEPGRVFCRRCGAELEQPVPPPPVLSDVPAGRMPMPLLAVGGIVAVGILAVVAVFAIGGLGGPGSSASAPPGSAGEPSAPIGPSSTAGPAGLIAWASGTADDADIVTGAPDGSSLTTLIERAGRDVDPAWSPDRSTLAWSSADGLRALDLASGSDTPLTDGGPEDRNPDWSPDGERIAYASRRDGDYEIHVLDLASGDDITLTDNDADDHDPVWSPDGSQIAFSSDRDGDVEIWVMSPDGSNQRPLTDDDATDGDPSWSPEGSILSFSSDRDGRFRIYLLEAGQVRPLTSGEEPDRDSSWSTDGAYLVVQRGSPPGLVVIDLAGRDVARLTPAGQEGRFPAWR